jgi:hypothetical protein
LSDQLIAVLVVVVRVSRLDATDDELSSLVGSLQVKVALAPEVWSLAGTPHETEQQRDV